MPPPKLRRSTRRTTTALYRPPEPRQDPCVVDNLPDELIREIFESLFESWAVPISLFLVNHRWNEIATSISLLRSVIHIAKPQDYALVCTEYEKPVFCTSSDHFTRALARIGNAKFDLFISWIPTDLVLSDHPLSTRCRFLEIELDLNAEIPTAELPDMCVLQELVIGLWSLDSEPASRTEARLFERLETTSPSLRSLTIRGRLPTSLFDHRQLLERLTEMKLATYPISLTPESSETLLSSLNNIEKFSWQPLRSPMEGLVLAPVSTKILTYMNILRIPPQDYKNLVTLICGYKSTSEMCTRTDVLLHFPALHILEIYGNWCEISRIRAPVLHRLTLGHTSQGDAEIKELLPLVQIKPEIIYISNHMSDLNLVSLLGGIWSHACELHLACLRKREAPGPILIRALSGTVKKDPVCLNLWCLTVQFTSSEKKDPGLIRRSFQRLQQVVADRKRKGVNSLERVQCGWVDDMAEEADSSAWIDVL